MQDTTLTMDQIRAAANKDVDAIRAVIEATETRVLGLARTAARKAAPNDSRFHDLAEDFAQTGRIAVWECLGRFSDDSVDAFLAYVYRTVEHEMTGAINREVGLSDDEMATWTFVSMLKKADGDALLAEKMCQTVPPANRRLSANRAYAARLAYQGTTSMDLPNRLGGWDDPVSTYGVPEDLITVADLNQEDRRIKHAVVGSILDVMGPNQRDVLKYSFGIHGYTLYGYGRSGDIEGLATEMKLSVEQVIQARKKGLTSFTNRYIKAMAATPARAKELEEAAAAMRIHAGRK